MTPVRLRLQPRRGLLEVGRILSLYEHQASGIIE